MDWNVVSEGIVAATAVVAVVIAALAFRTSLRAASSADTANQLAEEANRIVDRAVNEAGRSAEAAEVSLTLQREEAAASAAARHAADLAEVRPVMWEGRATAKLRGLQIRNYGPSRATSIRCYVRMGESSFRSATRDFIAPDETVAFAESLRDHFPLGVDGIPVPSDREVAARVVWVNGDHSEGDTGWLLVRRT